MRRVVDLALEVVGVGEAARRRASSCSAAVYREGRRVRGLEGARIEGGGDVVEVDSVGDIGVRSSSEAIDGWDFKEGVVDKSERVLDARRTTVGDLGRSATSV